MSTVTLVKEQGLEPTTELGKGYNDDDNPGCKNVVGVFAQKVTTWVRLLFPSVVCVFLQHTF